MTEFAGRNEEEAAVARARAALSPTAADAQRVKGAIVAALAAGNLAAPAAAARAGASGASGTAAAGTSKLAVIGLTAGLTALIAGGAGYLIGHRTAPAHPPAAPLPVTVVEVPASAVEPASAAPPAARPLPTVAGSTVPSGSSGHAPARRGGRLAGGESGASTAADPSLDQELRALRSVERALRDRQPGLALALLAALDRDVPGGKLVEEREAMLVIARCAQADPAIRLELEGAFGGRHPGSVYLQRVRQACGPRSLSDPQRIRPEAETDGKQEATP